MRVSASKLNERDSRTGLPVRCSPLEIRYDFAGLSQVVGQIGDGETHNPSPSWFDDAAIDETLASERIPCLSCKALSFFPIPSLFSYIVNGDMRIFVLYDLGRKLR